MFAASLASCRETLGRIVGRCIRIACSFYAVSAVTYDTLPLLVAMGDFVSIWSSYNIPSSSARPQVPCWACCARPEVPCWACCARPRVPCWACCARPQVPCWACCARPQVPSWACCARPQVPCWACCARFAVPCWACCNRLAGLPEHTPSPCIGDSTIVWVQQACSILMTSKSSVPFSIQMTS
jgi:hypothetical protein